MSSALQDSSQRYGAVSRALHWAMALVLGWQFFTTLVRILMEDSTLDEFTWGTHRAAGVLLMLLIVLRVIWALINRHRRPASLSLAARLGHLGMYLLMLLVPTLALLRQYGSGRELNVYGLQLMSGFEGERIDWMMAPANLLHGWLGWTLLAMIVGHIGMTLYHRRHPAQNVLPRMTGKLND
ncbi:MAG: cytochrome b [Pseudoalteromonas distincta]|jgi:cytochrome b561|tara:strand:- start:69005 stop:69550 length:546 start_codon:yes stop_codon:yes gene_type:complete